MINACVSTALRVAIHFGKWVASYVSLVVVLINKEVDFNNDVKGMELRTQKLCRDLVKKFILFYKLRRRVFRMIAKTYPDFVEPKSARRWTPLSRLLMRLEEVAGQLDEVMANSRQTLAIDDGLPQYAASLWRGRKNPPPLIELDLLKWGQHELEEDCLLEDDSSRRLFQGEDVAPGPLSRRNRKRR